MASPEIWHEASAGEQTFRYLDSGEGPLVVLLHGFPDLPQSWDTIRPRLNAAGFRTVAPYLRGYHPATLNRRRFRVPCVADGGIKHHTGGSRSEVRAGGLGR